MLNDIMAAMMSLFQNNGDHDIFVSKLTLNLDNSETVCPITYLLGGKGPQLDSLRRFRDKVLARSTLGIKVIQLYYKSGDKLIEIFKQSSMIKKPTKNILEPIMPGVEKRGDNK